MITYPLFEALNKLDYTYDLMKTMYNKLKRFVDPLINPLCGMLSKSEAFFAHVQERLNFTKKKSN